MKTTAARTSIEEEVTPTQKPVVKVALATYQGMAHLERQVSSILAQEGVEVALVASDDASTDGTREWLEALADADPRVTLLPPRGGDAGVAPNFLYAFQHLDLKPGEFAAFADQDDVWWPGKLRTQIEFLKQKNADAVSSNVLAFSNDGKFTQEIIRKDQVQTRWDHIFEAPSAGSTFLFTEPAWEQVVDYVKTWGIEGIALHDWFSYAVVRAAGMDWWIDPRPHVAYRQHDRNALGAHKGLDAMWHRYNRLRAGYYREQFLLTAEVARRVGKHVGRPQAWLDDLDGLIGALEDQSARGRLEILGRLKQIRRRPIDQLALAASCALRVW